MQHRNKVDNISYNVLHKTVLRKVSANDGWREWQTQRRSCVPLYKCSGVKRKLGCDKRRFVKAWIEDPVIAELKKIVNDDETIAYIANCVMELQGRGIFLCDDRIVIINNLCRT